MVKKRIFFVFLLLIGLILVGKNVLYAETVNDRLRSLVTTAEVYSKQGNPLMAAKMFDQAIRLSPNNLELYYRRGLMWGKGGYYSAAVKDFTLVINREKTQKKESFSHAARFRADCYAAMGALPQAVADYKEFLRKAPKDGKVWSYLAEAYSQMMRNDLALQAIAKGIATGSHWEGRLKTLQKQILTGEKITPHKPLLN